MSGLCEAEGFFDIGYGVGIRIRRLFEQELCVISLTEDFDDRMTHRRLPNQRVYQYLILAARQRTRLQKTRMYLDRHFENRFHRIFAKTADELRSFLSIYYLLRVPRFNVLNKPIDERRVSHSRAQARYRRRQALIVFRAARMDAHESKPSPAQGLLRRLHVRLCKWNWW